MINNLLLLYVIPFIISAAGAWCVAAYGSKLSLIDTPNERSSHNIPTPKGGGIGILAAFLYTAIALNLPKTFWIPAALLSLISMIDDIKEISVKIRLIAQIASSIIFLGGMFSYRTIPSETYILFLILPIFIVGTINFYNFMDGINGIAGINGITAFGFLSYYGYLYGKPASLVILSIAIAASCAGFLIFNIPKAKVFMGDAGSILLGFLFASITLIFTSSFLEFLCIISFLFLFYTDELTTMALRLKNRENLSIAHRKHLFQLLANEYSIPHWKVSSYYGAVQIFISTTVLISESRGTLFVFLLLLFYFISFSCVSYYIRKTLT